MNPINTTAIFLTEEEAKLFIEYQKRYTFMKLLESIGAFDIKNGSLTIHFDNVGAIQKLDKQQHYKVP